MLTFRKALKTDKEFLLDLRYDTMEEHLIRAGYSTTREGMLKRVEYKWESAMIIQVDRSVDPWHLVQIQIHSKYRNRGIGKKILAELIQEGIREGKDIRLEALKENKVLRLYKSIGFEEVEVEVEVEGSTIKMLKRVEILT